MKPQTTAKGPLFHGPSQHLLAGRSQKMSMPYHQDTNANMRLRRSEGHPLSHPWGKVINGIHRSGVDLFKVASVFIGVYVVSPLSAG
jgi:hypothetical protein